MSNTFQLFDELLAHDPGSRIFFPLARLYRKEGLLDRAIEIMLTGIEHHSDFLEAQLYLIELLSEANRTDEATHWGQSVLAKLMGYEKFWGVLRAHFSAIQRPDLSLASLFFERNAGGETVDLLQLISAGIDQYKTMETAPSTSKAPAEDLDAEEVTQLCLNAGIRTKTMAKLLYAQGEFAQAVKIYDDLLETPLDEDERSEIRDLRTAARGKLPADPATDKSSRLYEILNSLASRLEERAASLT